MMGTPLRWSAPASFWLNAVSRFKGMPRLGSCRQVSRVEGIRKSTAGSLMRLVRPLVVAVSYTTNVDWTNIPASWTRFATRSMPPSELRHETGTQKLSTTTVSAIALATTSNASIFVSAGTATSRKSRTAENSAVRVAAVTMPANTVNATRRKVLLNSGPPGKNANTQTKAPAVVSAIMQVSLPIVPTADSLRRMFFDRRRMTASTDVSDMQIRMRIAIAVTSRAVVWELNGRK